ncbi:MAG: redoxin domain-containing protein [Phycisphaerales bacterium]|nr:redoxin domain-containing protein [Phycisphaerales bacterium]
MPTELTPRTSPIKVGEAAPDFTLKDQNRADWTLSEAVKRGPVVLCFYPMDFSPVCSTEMQCITSDFAKWEAKGAQVVGVSCDSFFVHKAWADALGLKQTLLADMHRAVCKAYGFYWSDLNIATRGTVILERDAAGEARVKWVQAREIPQAMNPEELLQALS